VGGAMGPSLWHRVRDLRASTVRSRGDGQTLETGGISGAGQGGPSAAGQEWQALRAERGEAGRGAGQWIERLRRSWRAWQVEGRPADHLPGRRATSKRRWWLPCSPGASRPLVLRVTPNFSRAYGAVVVSECRRH